MLPGLERKFPKLLITGFDSFKEYTGFSPARYILDIRISKVKEALTNSTLPVKQIAYDFGFENYDYFFTAFRSLTGKTPSEYRALTQGK